MKIFINQFLHDLVLLALFFHFLSHFIGNSFSYRDTDLLTVLRSQSALELLICISDQLRSAQIITKS